jgi:hypothetical protein
MCPNLKDQSDLEWIPFVLRWDKWPTCTTALCYKSCDVAQCKPRAAGPALCTEHPLLNTLFVVRLSINQSILALLLNVGVLYPWASMWPTISPRFRIKYPVFVPLSRFGLAWS